MFLIFAFFALALAAAPESTVPEIELSLVAENPVLSTPTGAAVDTRGRLLIIENNTHFRPDNYDRHASDRVLWLHGGKASTFHEGETHSTDLAAHSSGAVYLATRGLLLRLQDKDGDGRSEKRDEVLRLETTADYPHNGLGGIAFDAAGDIYIGLGENFGAPYTLHGEDCQLTGSDEGGNIFWCRADGSELRRVATGFWNPFGLCVTPDGLLFATDNDPDSVPFCRLLHIVPGGDYGFRYAYNRSGLGPMQSWYGDKPGTLPMAAATGEAPCGILPWQGGLLVAAWGEHRIEYYRLRAHGQSYLADRQVIIQGGPDFRPVEIAAGLDDSLYITDWVDRSYKLHGKGRVWRVTGADILRADPPPPQPELPKNALSSDDPFAQLAAAVALSRTPQISLDVDNTIGSVLAMRFSGDPAYHAHLPGLLKDKDARVRDVTLRWIADAKLVGQRDAVAACLDDPDQPAAIAMTALSTLARLDGTSLNRKLAATYLSPIVRDESRSAKLRRYALRALPANKQLNLAELASLARHEDLELRREAVQRLALHPKRAGDSTLLSIAMKGSQPDRIRAEAVLGLQRTNPDHRTALIAITSEPQSLVRDAALRKLAGSTLTNAQRAVLMQYAKINEEATARALGHPPIGRPLVSDLKAWELMATGPGDARAGELLFFSDIARCSSCHRVAQRGAHVGPDLSQFGVHKSNAEILRALLDPSGEVAPQFHTWIITLKNGKSLTGFLYRKRVGGAGREEYLDLNGKLIEILTDDVVSRKTLPVSIMPPSLLLSFTQQELRDLLAFLRQPPP
jgi:putative membrane-bound dehydrogenase-like protein